MADYAYTQEDVYYGDSHWQGDSAQPGAPKAEPAKASISKAISLFGAAASLALVAGVGVWGYKLIMRDVTGVPVVRAAQGPMRMQPEDPGGRQADHQGLSVNAIAASGSAAPTADRLALAPRNVELAEEDAPVAVGEPAALRPADQGDLEPIKVSADAVASFQQGSVGALVDQLTGDIEQTQQEAIDQVVAELTPEPAVVTGPGPARSWRPVARPANFKPKKSDASVVKAAAAAPATVEIKADTLPVGTRLAQLGAYDSEAVARAEWDKFQARFGDYMEGKQRVIQKASSGGRTFYRLRAAGFKDLSDARRFCSALVAENADCIPVTTR